MMPSNSRVNNMLRTSGGTYYDEDTGEVIKPSRSESNYHDRVERRNTHFDNLQKSASKFKNSMSNVRMPKFVSPKMPPINTGAIINIAIIGGIALVGYKLYMKFFGTSEAVAITNKIAANGDVAIAKTVVDAGGAKAAQLTQTASSLQAKGMTVSPLHQSLANTFHDYLDSSFPDHDKIVKTIKGENIQTFRLVSVAYGTRTVPSYCTLSLSHLFDFSTEFTLKETLQMILNSDEQTLISIYLSVI